MGPDEEGERGGFSRGHTHSGRHINMSQVCDAENGFYLSLSMKHLLETHRELEQKSSKHLGKQIKLDVRLGDEENLH